MKHITIIGGGLGGLTAGALLSKDGFSVTLLEQHNIIGGCATTFQRKGGFTCEVGLHEMDGVFTNPNIIKIFDKLDVYKNVEFKKPQEFFKVHTKYGEFVMPNGLENGKNVLKEKFVNERDAIDEYFRIVVSISNCFLRLSNLKWHQYLLFPFIFYPIIKYKNKTVSEVLNNLTQNEELKLILNANVQYYNDTSDTLSFLLHAVAQSSYYQGGGHFIKGGSYKLSEYLGSIIKNNGGEVITKAMVFEATKNSVTYTYKNEKITKSTDIIISNISPYDTYKLFDISYNEVKQIANSITTIYFGFNQNLKSIYGQNGYSNFIFTDEKPFVFVDYSQIDSGLTGSDKSFGSICFCDELSNWDKLDEAEYRQKKEQLLESYLCKLNSYYPNIKQYIEFSEVSTPKTIAHYIKTPNGTAYGYKPTQKQFFKIPKVKSHKIDNLYFVGQFVIAGGFSPSLMSGLICYENIVKEYK